MPKFTIPNDFTDRQRKEKLMDKLIAEKLVEISTFAEKAKCHRLYHFKTRLAHAPATFDDPSTCESQMVVRVSTLRRREREAHSSEESRPVRV